MGTRSITRIIETSYDVSKNKKSSKKLLTMYRQFDGYPSGMGLDLFEFLKDGKIVNGFSPDEAKKNLIFNGVGCLAAQLVAHFKDGTGNIYIMPNDTKDAGQEYEYEIIVDCITNTILFKCIEIGYVNSKGVYCNGKKVLYSGEVKDFEKFLTEMEKSSGI